MLKQLWILQMTLLIFLSAFDAAVGLTATKCEGETIHLICIGGYLEVTAVMYGRKGDSICNSGPIQDTDCEAEGALEIVASSCNGQSECFVPASNTVFGDPCVGTFKYLSIQFLCHDESTDPPSTTTSMIPVGEMPNHCSNISTAFYHDDEGMPIPENCLTYYEQTLIEQYEAAYVLFLLLSDSCNDHGIKYSLSIEGELDNLQIYAQEYEEESNVFFSATIMEQFWVIDNSSMTDLQTCIAELHLYLDEHYSDDVIQLDEIPAAGESCPRLKMLAPPAETWASLCCNPGYFMESNMCYLSPSVILPVTEPEDIFCELKVASNLTWLPTPPGEADSQLCPEGSVGTAMWQCLETGEWDPQGPDLSNCSSDWVDQLTDKISTVSTPEEATDLAEEVNQASQDGNILTGDIENLVGFVQNIVDVLAQQLDQLPNEDKQSAAQSLVESNVGTCSNLLDLEKNQEAWDGLETDEQSRQAADLLKAVESTAFLMVDNLASDADTNTVSSETDNILMQVSLYKDIKENVIYPEVGDNEKWDVSIEIPQESLADQQTSDGVKLVLLTYGSVGGLLGIANNVVDQDTADLIINSKVISASINQLGTSTPLQQPAKFTFEHQEIFNQSDAFCSYWDETGSTGFWSGAGCVKVKEESNSSQTVCQCDHLTNFAILMDVHGTEIAASHEFALRLFTYIGFGISSFCLIFCIVTFCILRSLKSDRTTIHKNLCICLLVAEVVFMAGIDQIHSKVGCAVVAGLLHYFFLASFAWMALEGVQLYVMLVEVFEAEYSRTKYYYLVGYGFPAIIVGISAGLRYEGYGTEDYCWLSTDQGLIWSFVGPVLAVIVVNFGFLVMALYIMCRHSTVTMKGKKVSQKMANTENKWKSAATWIRGSVVLLCLLGITWGVGLFYVNQDSLVMAYIFTIFNSLQGLAIFIFHAALNEKVRKEYKKCLYRSDCMPDCMRLRLGDSIYKDSLPPGSRSSSSAKLQKVWYQNRSNSTSSTYDKKYSTSTTSKNTVESYVKDSIGKENGYIVPYNQMLEVSTQPCLTVKQDMGQRSPPRSISEPLQFEDGSPSINPPYKHSKSLNDFKYIDQYDPEDEVRFSVRT